MHAISLKWQPPKSRNMGAALMPSKYETGRNIEHLKIGQMVYDKVTNEKAQIVTFEDRRIVLFLMQTRLHARRWAYQLSKKPPETREAVLAAVKKIQPHNKDGVDCLAKLPTRQALKVAKAAYCTDLSIRTVAAEMGFYFDKKGGFDTKPRQ